MRKLFIIIVVLTVTIPFVPATKAQTSSGVLLTLNPTEFAAGVGLQAATGTAHIVPESGYIRITFQSNGAVLPANSVLAGWVVDSGLMGGSGLTNASENDELFGVSFLNADFDGWLESAPYALSVGTLVPTVNDAWELIYQLPNYSYNPYDSIVVTLESDGNTTTGYDPRPGTPIFVGDIATGVPTDDVLIAVETPAITVGMQIMLRNAQTVAALNAVTGYVNLDSTNGIFELNLNLNGVAVPTGTLLEAWLIDAGLETNGPGVSNASNFDENFGVSFGNAEFDALVERTFYPLSLGFADIQSDGLYGLRAHLPATNFSPYDAILITAETDSTDLLAFDPRPGSPVLLGLISDGVLYQPTGSESAAVSSLPTWQTMPLRNVRTGETFTIADLSAAGITVMIEPMATWCSNCRAQQRIVREVYNTADPNRVMFISLSVETHLDDATVAAYALNEGFDWTFVLADDALLQELVNQFGRSITSPPSTPHFVVYADGSFSSLLTGRSSEDDLKNLLGL